MTSPLEKAAKARAARQKDLDAPGAPSPLRRRMAADGVEQLNVNPRSNFGRLWKKRGVSDTPELRRIQALPRRQFEGLDELAREITERYRVPGGTFALRPLQAAALRELHDFRGLFAPMGVGVGKTLVTFLAPAVLGARRYALVVPASLREKTRADFAEYAVHFERSLCELRIWSYEELSREDRAHHVDSFAPDLVVCDEAHRLKNKRAAVTKRLGRYLEAHPDVVFAVLSGTMTRRALEDFAHLAERALGERLCPVPTVWGALVEWDLATMEKLPPDAYRLPPGALTHFFDDAERAMEDQVAAARRAVGRRIRDTPGVVASVESSCDASLNIEVRMRPLSKSTRKALQLLREKWELPDGTELADAPAVWRHARELAFGFFYRWSPEPPEAWMEARRAWKRVCRYLVKNNRSGIDTEKQLITRLRSGSYTDAGGEALDLLEAWRAVKDTYEPTTVPEWVDRSVADDLYLGPGFITWFEHRALAERLAERMPVYGEGALDVRTGRHVRTEDGTREVAASVRACGTGQNLQAFSRNYLPQALTGGLEWHQLLGRTHRPGQTADEVSVVVDLAVKEDVDALAQSFADARRTQDVSGEPHRLLLATVSGWPSTIAEQDALRAKLP